MSAAILGSPKTTVMPIADAVVGGERRRSVGRESVRILDRPLRSVVGLCLMLGIDPSWSFPPPYLPPAPFFAPPPPFPHPPPPPGC